MTNKDFYVGERCDRLLTLDTGRDGVRLWTRNSGLLPGKVARIEIEDQTDAYKNVHAQLSRDDLAQLIAALAHIQDSLVEEVPEHDYLVDCQGDYWVLNACGDGLYACGTTLERAQQQAAKNYGGGDISVIRKEWGPAQLFKLETTTVLKTVEEVQTESVKVGTLSKTKND